MTKIKVFQVRWEPCYLEYIEIKNSILSSHLWNYQCTNTIYSHYTMLHCTGFPLFVKDKIPYLFSDRFQIPKSYFPIPIFFYFKFSWVPNMIMREKTVPYDNSSSSLPKPSKSILSRLGKLSFKIPYLWNPDCMNYSCIWSPCRASSIH